jgi:hypothetical protein
VGLTLVLKAIIHSLSRYIGWSNVGMY